MMTTVLFSNIQVTDALQTDYPDIGTSSTLISGFLYVPLLTGRRSFMVFLRREHLRRVRWARTPTDNVQPESTFGGQPEMVRGRSRPWTNEQVEKASILRLLFSEVRARVAVTWEYSLMLPSVCWALG
jgi:light-regulated signal transduction histidine kinase (bacteriophytochrome)